MILVARQDASFATERDEVAELRLDLVELGPRRLAGGVSIPLHAVAGNTERRAGAEHLLRAVGRVDRIDIGRHQPDRHAAFLESLGEFRQIILDARRLDVTALADGDFDAFEAELRDRLGELIVRQADEMLREEAEGRSLRRRRRREQGPEHRSRHQRTGETQQRTAREHRLTCGRCA